MAGKHGRRRGDDVPRKGNEPILAEDHSMETAVAHLQGSQGQATVRVADKRLKGQYPYHLEDTVSGPPVQNDDE